MSSYERGKPEVCSWIRSHYPQGATCLDVGACDGLWYDLLGDYLIMDAIEIWEPNISYHNLKDKYRLVIWGDIAKRAYPHYNLIIFGDVLEHMPVKAAQEVLAYADTHSDDYIVALPFNYYQGAIYGNPYERHLQPDLTPEVVAERYPQLEPIWQDLSYAYYHRRGAHGWQQV